MAGAGLLRLGDGREVLVAETGQFLSLVTDGKIALRGIDGRGGEEEAVGGFAVKAVAGQGHRFALQSFDVGAAQEVFHQRLRQLRAGADLDGHTGRAEAAYLAGLEGLFIDGQEGLYHLFCFGHDVSFPLSCGWPAMQDCRTDSQRVYSGSLAASVSIPREMMLRSVSLPTAAKACRPQ